MNQEEIAADGLLEVAESKLTPLEFSRQSAKLFDSDAVFGLELLLLLSGCKENPFRQWSAVEIQAMIEKNWDRINSVLNIDFPYIIYTPHISGGGMVGDIAETKYRVDEMPADLRNALFAAKGMADKTIFLNPTQFPHEKNRLSALERRKDHEVIDYSIMVHSDHTPLFVFAHEARHLYQVQQKHLIRDTKARKLYWMNKEFKPVPPSDYDNYLMSPHEHDANTTAYQICQTLSNKEPIDNANREEGHRGTFQIPIGNATCGVDAR